ncbi:MAG TPA: EamA family transporter RarD [Phycisphaerales bacterium]|nr:EamA family transporter RarD [Phycisphaerales bacterium]
MSLSEHNENARSSATSGVFFALGAYGWWAIVTPVYFRILKDVPAFELLSWRVLTGLPVLLLLLMATRRLNEFTSILRDRRILLTLLLSALLLSVNWFTFVWAVITDNLVEASLGYYVNPLVSIVLGMFFLGERLRGFQIVAVLIAAIGVVVMGLSIGHPPWIALTLAVSFGFYGLLRKKVSAAPAPGLAIEMMIVFPLMLLLLFLVHVDDGVSAFAGPGWVTILLVLGGPQSIVPLLFFTGAAKRLKLSTVGVMQYLAPTGQLVLAVLVFDETFTTGALWSFILIWCAVLLYSIDSVRRSRREQFEISIPGEA